MVLEQAGCGHEYASSKMGRPYRGSVTLLRLHNAFSCKGRHRGDIPGVFRTSCRHHTTGVLTPTCFIREITELFSGCSADAFPGEEVFSALHALASCLCHLKHSRSHGKCCV